MKLISPATNVNTCNQLISERKRAINVIVIIRANIKRYSQKSNNIMLHLIVEKKNRSRSLILFSPLNIVVLNS